MGDRRKLVLLADILDRKGFMIEAGVVDEAIEKYAFDEETRGDIADIVPEIQRLIQELDSAVKIGIPGLSTEDGGQIRGFSGGLEGQVKDYYLDRLQRLKDATEYVSELNGLMQSQWDDESDPSSSTEEEEVEPSGEDEPSDDSEATTGGEWWRFWDRDNESSGSEGPEAEEDDSGIIGMPDPEAEEDDSGIIGMPDPEAEEDDSERFKRTRVPGVNVEQSISNVGNVTIGE